MKIMAWHDSNQIVASSRINQTSVRFRVFLNRLVDGAPAVGRVQAHLRLERVLPAAWWSGRPAPGQAVPVHASADSRRWCAIRTGRLRDFLIEIHMMGFPVQMNLSETSRTLCVVANR